METQRHGEMTKSIVFLVITFVVFVAYKSACNMQNYKN